MRSNMKSDKKPSLLQNCLYSSGAEILDMILPFVTAPYITRVLTAERLGTYTYAHSLVQYFVLFAALGVTISGNRAIARTKDDPGQLARTFSAIYISQVFASLLVTLAYILWLSVLRPAEIYFPLFFLLLGRFFQVSWALHGLEKFRTTALLCTGIRLLSVGAVFAFVHDPADLLVYAYIHNAAVLLQNILTFVIVKKHIKLVRVSGREVWAQGKSMLAFFIPVLSVSLYKTMDKVMIGALTNDMAGVSNYYYAEQMLNIPQGIIAVLGGVLLPRMSHLSTKDGTKAEQEQIAKATIVFSMFLSCALSCGVAGVSAVFVPLYLGSEYMDCGRYILYLFPTAIMISWTTMMRNLFLIPQNKDKSYFVSVIAGAGVNFWINMALLPRLGIEGAIIGTIAAEFLTMLLQTISVSRLVKISGIIRNVLPFFCMGMGMLLVCTSIGRCMPMGWLTLALQVLLGAVVYVTLSCVYIKRNPHMGMKTKNNGANATYAPDSR